MDENGLSRFWADAPRVAEENGADRAALLIAAGLGRRRLSRELGMSEYEARQLLERSRRQGGDAAGSETNGDL